ncbi:MAG: 2Fe-2S iron-sulfur cluster binding domain-containing protein [Chloroflexi bacterium]|nr:MAG: 2Fe-2S iron-sulfur cluster binding domain-containing protein [Chloroflexota bacterium]
MPDINLTIDGHKLTVPAGTLIVEAAKTVGIEIPVFCYHHKLDPVGACRATCRSRIWRRRRRRC